LARRLGLLAGHALLDEGRSHHDGEPEEEQHEGERPHPLGEPGRLGELLDDLERDPRAGEVDPEHLPQGAPVDLVDDLLHRLTRALELLGSPPGAAGERIRLTTASPGWCEPAARQHED
jgi:hypothetical protein